MGVQLANQLQAWRSRSKDKSGNGMWEELLRLVWIQNPTFQWNVFWILSSMEWPVSSVVSLSNDWNLHRNRCKDEENEHLKGKGHRIYYYPGLVSLFSEPSVKASRF